MPCAKRFFSIILILVLIVSAATVQAASNESPARGTSAPAAANTVEPLRIADGPWLQAPSETAVTVVWRTNLRCVSEVEFRAGETEPWTRAFSAPHGLRDIGHLHAVRLEGLKPGTPYRYRVVSKEVREHKPYSATFGAEVRSDEYSFTPLNPAKTAFSFIVLNDRHEKAAPLRAALQNIRWDGVDLVVLNGDMLNYFESEPQAFNAIIAPCVEAFAKSIPFVYVRGNHEARGMLARKLMDYFPTPDGRYYYAFTHGNVRFVVLDSGEDKPDTSPEYSGLVDFDRYRAGQTEWLKAEMQSRAFRRAAFRVLLIHMPFNVIEEDKAQSYGRKYIRDRWAPLFHQAGIDLMISAHTHRVSVHPPQKGKWNYPIVIGAPNTVIRGDAAGNRLKLTVAEDNGTVRHELEIARRAPWWHRWLQMN
ncbi:MAG: metallophosphoesterase family protein [Candidatus Sumerlaeia bacterium]|nr:metallophosphoesterase family protein [Candidatus Sumerlaeia bacterium]